MAAHLADRDSWSAWVAEDKQGICGHVWIQVIAKVPNPVDEPEAHGYLTNFYVAPRARGSGIGSALLETALAWCRGKHLHAVLLWATAHSHSLYERHGFRSAPELLQLTVRPPSASPPVPGE